MKLSCAIAGDLLPLYADDSCSGDSKAALEQHMKFCPACREQYNRMKNQSICPDGSADSDGQNASMVLYAKKMRRRRAMLAVLLPVAVLLFALVFMVAYQTLAILEHQGSGTVSNIPDDAFNLTAGALVCSVEQVGQSALYTNSTQIVVTVQTEGAFSGKILLGAADDREDTLMVGRVDAEHPTCIFTNLSSGNRYVLRVEDIAAGTVTVRGRVNLWQAVGMAWEDLF